jgi:hypothetical protein
LPPITTTAITQHNKFNSFPLLKAEIFCYRRQYLQFTSSWSELGMELPRFTHAASCLAEAATTLSAAAQAMAVAAQEFSSAGLELEMFRFGTVGGPENASISKETYPHGRKPGVDHTDVKPMARARENTAESFGSIADNDYYMSGKFHY